MSEIGLSGPAGLFKGFKSKAGKPYSAALGLDGEHKVKMELEGR